MGTTNRFKYACADCGWAGFFFKSEFARKSRPRCQGCGGTFLEPVTRHAKDRIVSGEAAHREQHDRLGKRLGTGRRSRR